MTPRDRLTRSIRRRAIEDEIDDDPAAGLVNLFDLWMVFAVAVLLTAVGITHQGLVESPEEARDLEDRMRPSGRSLQGNGQRLGVAYRLSSGEIVYVPESELSAAAASQE